MGGEINLTKSEGDSGMRQSELRQDGGRKGGNPEKGE